MAQRPTDLEENLARVARGDQEAARELVGRTHALVLRLVRAHRSRLFSDEDLAQEVYLTMFTKLDRYRPREGIPFEHWLSRLAVNTCRDALRTERRAQELPRCSHEARSWLAFLGGAPGAASADAESARELVDVLLAQLAPDDALVLTLLDLEQRPVAVIASITGWSESSVKVRAFRARRKLREIAARRERGLP